MGGRVGSIDKSSDHAGDGSRDLPVFSIVHRPTTLQRAPGELYQR
jgi:hypothetical protein